MKEESDAISKIKNDPKYFYSFAKKASKGRSQIGTLIAQNGELCNTTQEKAECLKEQYKSVFSKPDKKYEIVNSDDFFDIGETTPSTPAPTTHHRVEVRAR